MIITYPNKFLIPVIMLKDYRELLDIDEIDEDSYRPLEVNNNLRWSRSTSRDLLADRIVEYNINKLQNVSRKFLSDTMFDNNDAEKEIYDYISNIGDQSIQYYIIKYINTFMLHLRELEEEDCISISKAEFYKLMQSYVDQFKSLYNEFMTLRKNIKVLLTKEDEKAIEDYFMKKIQDIYKEHLLNIKCKEKSKEIDNLIQGIIEEVRGLLKEQIKKINEDLLSAEGNKIVKDEAYFKHQKEINDEIEKEG